MIPSKFLGRIKFCKDDRKQWNKTVNSFKKLQCPIDKPSKCFSQFYNSEQTLS